MEIGRYYSTERSAPNGDDFVGPLLESSRNQMQRVIADSRLKVAYISSENRNTP